MTGMTEFSTHLFQQKYSERYAQAAGRLEQAALGHDVGLQGYTTVSQARTLYDRLQPAASDLLLDLGAGRGWPGFWIAEASGCRVVALDLPYAAMQAAQVRLQQLPGQVLAAAVVADGAALPLASASCDAVVHADVF